MRSSSGTIAFSAQGKQAEAANREAATTYESTVQYTAPPEPTSVAFLGDSYTQGTGYDTSKYGRWSTRISQENDWLELNYGKGGTNFATAGSLAGGKPYHERLTDLILSRPDIVIVSTAGNSLSEDQSKGIRLTFETLSRELPDAQIIALSPFHWAGEYPDDLTQFGEEIEKEVEAVGGRYIDIGHPLGDRPSAIALDGTHPNDEGYRLLADAISDALQKTGVTRVD